MLIAWSVLWLLSWFKKVEPVCSPTTYYKNCWIRRFPGLYIAVEESQRRGATLLELYQEESALKCSRACCLSTNSSCNLAVYHYNTTQDSANCFHLHCPTLESCILRQKSNVILYNVTKGVDPDLLVFGKYFTSNYRVLPNHASSRLNVSEPLASDKRQFNRPLVVPSSSTDLATPTTGTHSSTTSQTSEVPVSIFSTQVIPPAPSAQRSTLKKPTQPSSTLVTTNYAPHLLSMSYMGQTSLTLPALRTSTITTTVSLVSSLTTASTTTQTAMADTAVPTTGQTILPSTTATITSQTRLASTKAYTTRQATLASRTASTTRKTTVATTVPKTNQTTLATRTAFTTSQTTLASRTASTTSQTTLASRTASTTSQTTLASRTASTTSQTTLASRTVSTTSQTTLASRTASTTSQTTLASRTASTTSQTTLASRTASTTSQTTLASRTASTTSQTTLASRTASTTSQTTLASRTASTTSQTTLASRTAFTTIQTTLASRTASTTIQTTLASRTISTTSQNTLASSKTLNSKPTTTTTPSPLIGPQDTTTNFIHSTALESNTLKTTTQHTTTAQPQVTRSKVTLSLPYPQPTDTLSTESPLVEEGTPQPPTKYGQAYTSINQTTTDDSTASIASTSTTRPSSPAAASVNSSLTTTTSMEDSQPYPNDTKGYISRNITTGDSPHAGGDGGLTQVWHLAANTVLVALATCATIVFGCCCSVLMAVSWRGRRRRKGRYRTTLRGKRGSMRLIKYVIVRESS